MVYSISIILSQKKNALIDVTESIFACSTVQYIIAINITINNIARVGKKSS